ncbi:ATP-binding protein, partial [Paenibacillus cisolokensis]|uniref:AAA family ATPase n=1 Tax=Paenibacillus cisolokensis TaxID=1658519 RepID=UPI003D27D3C1
MKKIELISLTLRNFKGIRDFRLDADGEDVNVFGDNAVGKTTLFDAFTWSLFDKDSQNKKDFEIKTLGPDGKVLEHGTNHEVEVVLLVNGKRRTLRKVFSEKWTKKRGAVTAEFTGHTTDYYVDGVPVKKGEYEAFIASIVKEEVFKLLTNPAFFNEQLKKDDRRRILIEVCGDLSDAEVITSNPELSELTGLLGERTLEGHRKMLAA